MMDTQRIYLIAYAHNHARIMSIEAVDKETYWECEKSTVKLELGATHFFIPEMVPKKDGGMFVSLDGAVAALVGRMERDIAMRQEQIRRLYEQIGQAKALV